MNKLLMLILLLILLFFIFTRGRYMYNLSVDIIVITEYYYLEGQASSTVAEKILPGKETRLNHRMAIERR